MTTVGNGKYTYEQVENWEKLPEGWELGQTAIVTDPEDRVYLFNRGEHPLIVLDRDGNYLASWGEGVLTDAHGMFIDDDQNLYLPVKNSHVVLKYDPKGNLLMTMGEWGKPSDTGWSGNYSDPVVRAAGPFNSPSDIAISPDGLLYISDGYGNARVHRFTPDGELVDSWGAPGKTGPGEFHVPHGVWVHTDGRVFVADRENNRMQIFDSEGNFLEQWLDLARPCDIYIDDDSGGVRAGAGRFHVHSGHRRQRPGPLGQPLGRRVGQRRPRRLGRLPRRHLREPESRRPAADQVPACRGLEAGLLERGLGEMPD